MRLLNCKLEDINLLKYNFLIEIECDYCHQSFYRKRKIVGISIKRNDLHGFCSKNCCAKFKQDLNKPLNVNCSECGKLFLRSNSAKPSKSGKVFCSCTCSGIYNSKNRIRGNRRSKLEVYLESELTKLYPNLDIHFNRKDTINSELDIFIPSLKLAFELNGIFHYEPIYGSEKLESIQNNDQRKFQACLEKGIELCIINSSKQKKFTIKNSKEFLEIINKIINYKMVA